MSIRKILTDQDPALHKKCHPVTQFDGKLAALLDDMRDTLADANGAGLAAPQIGILRRAVVVIDDDGEMLELVNPEIVKTGGEDQDGLEGCLSLPDLWGYVVRPGKVRVKAQDRTGKWFEAEGEGIVARCFCHELDHLDGHVFSELADRLYTSEEIEAMQEQDEKKSRRRKKR